MQNTASRDAIEVVDDFFENRSRRRRCLDREIVRMDRQSMPGSAYDDGVAEGLAGGIKQGIEKAGPKSFRKQPGEIAETSGTCFRSD